MKTLTARCLDLCSRLVPCENSCSARARVPRAPVEYNLLDEEGLINPKWFCVCISYYLSLPLDCSSKSILNKGVTGREELCLNGSKASLLSHLQHSFLIRSSTSGVIGDVVKFQSLVLQGRGLFVRVYIPRGVYVSLSSGLEASSHYSALGSFAALSCQTTAFTN